MARLTSDPNDPDLTHGVDNAPTPQAKAYLVLSEEERAKGFVRPVRRTYQHLVCGSTTTMSTPLAETYAADPHHYGATYCCVCQQHCRVGAEGEFVWVKNNGTITDLKVGT